MDEVSFALEERKTVIPVIHKDCIVPFRLRRVQYVDFRKDYARGLKELLKTLNTEQSTPGTSDARSAYETDTKPAGKGERAAEEERRKAVEAQTRVAEQSGVNQEREQAAKQEQLEQEHERAAEQAGLEEDEARRVAERARLEGEPTSEGQTPRDEHAPPIIETKAHFAASTKPALGERLQAGLIGAVLGLALGGVAVAGAPTRFTEDVHISLGVLVYTCAGAAIAGVIVGKRWNAALCALVGAVAGWICVGWGFVTGQETGAFTLGGMFGVPLGAITGAVIAVVYLRLTRKR
jgi:hypothetical protein